MVACSRRWLLLAAATALLCISWAPAPVTAQGRPNGVGPDTAVPGNSGGGNAGGGGNGVGGGNGGGRRPLYLWNNYACPEPLDDDLEGNCFNLTAREMEEVEATGNLGAAWQMIPYSVGDVPPRTTRRSLLAPPVRPSTLYATADAGDGARASNTAHGRRLLAANYTFPNDGDTLLSFDIARPVNTPTGALPCVSEIMGWRSFSCNAAVDPSGCTGVSTVSNYYNKYDAPWSGPGSCASLTNGFKSIILTINFKAPAGNQYDRLWGLWIGGAAAGRGVTSEPSSVGTRWTVRRDVTHLASVLSQGAGILFELDNVVDATYTSPFWARAQLEFYAAGSPAEVPTTVPSAVIPLTNIPNGYGYYYSLSPSNAFTAPTTFTLPARNYYRAQVEVYVSAGGCEEFFWARPSGYSCDSQTMANQYREVRVLLDGAVVGFQPIWPVWYSGGYSPTAWRVIVGHTSHNLYPYLLDLSPYAGVLSNGAPHTISIQVGNAFSNYWFGDSNLLLWQGPAGSTVTTSSGPTVTTPLPGTISYTNRALRTEAQLQVSYQDSTTATVTARSAFVLNSFSSKVSGRGSSWSYNVNFGSTAYSTVASSGAALHDITTSAVWASSGSATTVFQVLHSRNDTATTNTFASLSSPTTSVLPAPLTQRHWQATASATSCPTRNLSCDPNTLVCGTTSNRAKLESPTSAAAGATCNKLAAADIFCYANPQVYSQTVGTCTM